MTEVPRLFTPRKGEHGPVMQAIVGAIGDTGGGWYRPTFRTQNPATDPKEPYGSESASRGEDHGWANCTMAAGAMVLDFDTLGSKAVWGGDLRHHQSDQEGGTDLNDLKEAWAYYGQTLSIRSGNGWDDVQADRAAGRALVLQGEGGTPGAGVYTGGHAIAVLPETKSDGKWLIGNPECTGFEWVSESALRDWAENWSSSIAWARSDPHLSGGTDVGAGITLFMDEAWAGTAIVQGDNHLYFLVSDGSDHTMSDGWEKEVFAKAHLATDIYTSGGSKIVAGTKVVCVGDHLAIILEADVELIPAEPDEFEPVGDLYVRRSSSE